MRQLANQSIFSSGCKLFWKNLYFSLEAG